MMHVLPSSLIIQIREHDSASLLMAVPPFCKVDVPVMSHLVINYMWLIRELFCNSFFKDFPMCI